MLGKMLTAIRESFSAGDLGGMGGNESLFPSRDEKSHSRSASGGQGFNRVISRADKDLTNVSSNQRSATSVATRIVSMEGFTSFRCR